MVGWGTRLVWSAVVLALLIAFYAATYSFRGSTDTRLNRLQTRQLVLRGDVDLSRYDSLERTNVVRRDGKLYSIYGVGISLVAAPVYLVAAHLDLSAPLLEGLIAVPFAAAAVLVFFLLALRLFERKIAVAGTVLFGFGTTMWPIASMGFWHHAPVALFQMLGLRAFFDDRRNAPFWAGLALGAATFVRPTLAILAVLVGVFYLVTSPSRALRYAAGAALPLLGIVIQNRWIWGSYLEGGYSFAGIGFRGDAPSALWGELFGWWRGLFIYSPALVLAVVGWTLTFKRRGANQARFLLLGIAALTYVLFYARWTTWWGGFNQFGYRYLLDAVPLFVLLSMYALERVRGLARVGLPLGCLSVLTMAFGAAPNRYGWDFHLYPDSFQDSPIGQAWIVAVNHPTGAILRLVGVGAVGCLLWFAAQALGARTRQIA